MSASLFRILFAVTLSAADVPHVPERFQSLFGAGVEHPSDVQRLLQISRETAVLPDLACFTGRCRRRFLPSPSTIVAACFALFVHGGGGMEVDAATNRTLDVFFFFLSPCIGKKKKNKKPTTKDMFLTRSPAMDRYTLDGIGGCMEEVGCPDP